MKWDIKGNITVHVTGAKLVSNWKKRCYIPNVSSFSVEKDIYVNRLESVQCVCKCKNVFSRPEHNGKENGTEI